MLQLLLFCIVKIHCYSGAYSLEYMTMIHNGMKENEAYRSTKNRNLKPSYPVVEDKSHIEFEVMSQGIYHWILIMDSSFITSSCLHDPFHAHFIWIPKVRPNPTSHYHQLPELSLNFA